MFRVILNLLFCSENNKKKKYTSIDRSTISTIGEKFGQLNWILDESDENLNLIFLEKKKDTKPKILTVEQLEAGSSIALHSLTIDFRGKLVYRGVVY